MAHSADDRPWEIGPGQYPPCPGPGSLERLTATVGSITPNVSPLVSLMSLESHRAIPTIFPAAAGTSNKSVNLLGKSGCN